MVYLNEPNKQKEIFKFSRNRINKCSKTDKKITYKRKNLLSSIYLSSFLFIFVSSFCLGSEIDSLTKIIIYMRVSATSNDYYPIINKLKNVNSIKINGEPSNINQIYYLNKGEYQIAISFNKKLADCSELFMGCKCNFMDLSEFDTSQCTLFVRMFKDCTSLTSIKLGNNFNTNKAIDMTSMFENIGIDRFININLDNFNTSLVTNMKNMFRYASFKFLNLSNFVTSNVVNMEGMFTGSKIISIDLSSFDTSKVTNMGNMFSNCYNLISLDISNFDFSLVKSVDHIFYQINFKIKFCRNIANSKIIRGELNEANILEKCGDPCFTNNNNKFIISNISCIDNCLNSIYKYEYNNICYSECPTGTEEYPKGSYFCIDILDYKKSFYNYKKKEDINKIPIGYYYDNKIKKIIKKCPEKCKTCELESVIMDLCIECNTDQFYFEKENSVREVKNYKNCIKLTNTSERYLSSNNDCYESCESCIELGNSFDHKCINCKSNMILIKGSNCYNKCPEDEFYFIDDLNEYHCDKYCPQGYKPLDGQQKCTKNCSDEFPFILEMNQTCYSILIPSHFDQLINIRFKIPLEQGDIMNSTDGYFIFNSENVQVYKKMNFKIKANNFNF